MTDAQIKHMVARFLGWRLPENFNPDAGISFKADYNENTPYPMKHEPYGTNLFDCFQAEAMVRYMIEGMPESATLEDLLRMTVPVPAGCVAPEGTPMSPEFRVSVQSVREDGVHIIIHAEGHDSETLDFMVSGNELNPLGTK